MKPLTLGSLFAGIGGFELGLERTGGFKTEWQVEIDPFCRRVLAKHWPDVRRWDDVRTFPPPGEWGVDVICGGFPCQDISRAGYQLRIDAPRSGLWSKYASIIREIRPRFVIVENVAALLESGMGRVLGDLAKIGYDAEWQSIPAALLRAPHIRQRVWILAYPIGAFGDRPLLSKISGEMGRSSEIGCPDWKFFELGAHLSTRLAKWRSLGQPGLVRIDDGIPNVLDRLRGTGNAVVPQCAEWIGRRLLEAIGDEAS